MRDVGASLQRRLQLLDACRDIEFRALELEVCRRDVLHWFSAWAWTFDPREAGRGLTTLPFDLFPRQIDLVKFLQARIAAREDGLVEKSREIGFTWVTGGFAIHQWLFTPGFKTTFGSRGERLVDNIADPDSIFEKMRQLLRSLPHWMLPPTFDWSRHDNFLRLVNPDNGNTIRGEAGDQMGRGGRSTLYIIDEAAFIDRAERVEASTSANTDVRIWGSTVNGMGNLFARKRHGGALRPDQIFRFHWTDDPRKTDEWAVAKRNALEPHVWASEYDIDYSASVEGICIPAKWIESAQRASTLFNVEPARQGIGGLDVGGGKAKSVFVARFGGVVQTPVAWGDPDTIETAHRGLDAAQKAAATRQDGSKCHVAILCFDCLGLGRGVLDAMARSKRAGIRVVPVNVGEAPSSTRWPDGDSSEEKFVNLKAEAWFLMREAFKNTHEAVLHREGKGGQAHALSDLIILPTQGADALALAAQLSLPRWFRNERGKILLEKKDDLARRGIASPDYADALALTYTVAKLPVQTKHLTIPFMGRM